MKFGPRILSLLLFLCLCPHCPGQDQRTAQREYFENRIRPVLATHCVDCHGPDQQESELRVDHISFLRAPLSFGVPVVPGRPQESVLLQAIEHSDADLLMPEGGDKLSAKVIADFRKWIEQGAVWPDEPVPSSDDAAQPFDLEARKRRLAWIWQLPERQPRPQVNDPSWPRSEADYFILASLEQHGLHPAPDAKGEVWFRRVFFALTGLPPTPAQILEFQQDASPGARARVVDALLASPHFGERWARHWMDLVRYSESRGHESDFLIANAWRYRDYLIQAFNDDLPYDLFIVEQLAGDLLKNPRTERDSGANLSVLGTGWAFLGEEVHSPVDIRQDECDRIDNKIDVLSKTFLGLTVACARCHDHKFDAITQRDYYGLAGFVLSANYRQVRFESIEQNRQIADELDKLTRQTRAEMARVLADALRPPVGQFARRVADNPSAGEGEKIRLSDFISAAAEDPTNPLHLLADPASDVGARDRLRDKWRQQLRDSKMAGDGYQTLVDYSASDEVWLQDGFTFGLRPQRPGDLLIGDAEQPVRGVSTYHAAVKDEFWDVLQVASGNQKDSAGLAAQSRAGRMIRTRKVPLKSGRLFYLMTGEANVYAGVDSHIMIGGPLHGHLVRKVKGNLQWHEHNVHKSEGERVYVQLGAVAEKPLEIRKVVEGDESPRLLVVPNSILLKILESPDFTSPQSAARALQAELQTTLTMFAQNQFAGARDGRDRALLLDWMLQTPELFPIDAASQQRLKQLADDYQAARKRLRQQVRRQSATAVAWMDGNGVDEHVLLRGSHKRPGQSAPRDLPTAFAHSKPMLSATSGRLRLAREIACAENPLTARVMVNRVWHHVFGRGIVKTVDNFGYLGGRPSHPQLLDHLAWTFGHEDGWSVKSLIRRLVLSRTFSMSSQPTSNEAEEVDPDNVLLHRMSLRRLEAEAIRDGLLATSGRLDRTTMGPPIPVHHTEFVVGRGRPSNSGPLDGAGRRSIYTAVRRNFLPTLLLTFDMPTPFSTVGRRNVTNVPGQSLALMNDPLIHQQADVWANRILKEMQAATPRQRITRMYLEAFARRPDQDELDIGVAALKEFAQLHACSEEDSRAWRDLAHAFFSTNEFIYVR